MYASVKWKKTESADDGRRVYTTITPVRRS